MRNRIITLLVALSAVFMTGCSNIRNIELKSCALDSISMAGLRGINATLLLEIDNPALQFGLEDIEGVLYRNGEEYVTYKADPIKVDARTCAVYPLPCSATLSPEVSLIQVLSMARNFNLEEFTTDIHAKLRLKNGVAKGFTFRDIPIKDLMEE